MNPDAHLFFRGKQLVVFGAGYVGGELIRQALALGLKATALTRNPTRAAELSAWGAKTIVADLATDHWHGQIAGGADFVLDCVGAGGGGVDGYRRTYVDGLRSIFAWAGTVPVGTFVYTSSTSVYPQTGGMKVTEDAPTIGGRDTAQVLVEAEDVIRTLGDAVGRRWFILRLAGIYGPGRHQLLDQLRAGATELPSRGDQHLNLIHRDDICAAIWAAFAAPTAIGSLVFNVADDGAAPRAELADWLAARLGRPPPRFTGEAPSGRRHVTPDRIVVNERLKATLGWHPSFPTFREGFRDAKTYG
jgi:nucleoside-diphosphate-sugar epimerase